MELESIDCIKVNVADIIYENPVKVGSKYLIKPHNELIISTNLLTCSEIKISENRCYIIFELDNEKDYDLYHFFVDMDEKNICEIFKNSFAWFRKKMPLDVVEDYLKPFVRLSKDKILIKVLIPYKNKKIKLENHELIVNESKIAPCFRYNGISIDSQQFSSSWEMINFVTDDEYNHQYEIFNKNDEENLVLYVNDIQELEQEVEEVEKVLEQKVEKVEKELEQKVEKVEKVEKELEHTIKKNKKKIRRIIKTKRGKKILG